MTGDAAEGEPITSAQLVEWLAAYDRTQAVECGTSRPESDPWSALRQHCGYYADPEWCDFHDSQPIADLVPRLIEEIVRLRLLVDRPPADHFPTLVVPPGGIHIEGRLAEPVLLVPAAGDR